MEDPDPSGKPAEPENQIHLASSRVGSASPKRPNSNGAPQHDAHFAFQLLAPGGRDIVLILSRDGRIVEANQAAVSAYGYDRGTLLSKHIADLRPPREREHLSQQLAEARERGARFETVHRRADGSEFAVEVVSSSASIGEEQFLLSVVRDITDRKGVREQLERQASLLNLATEPIFAWYMDGGITYWNRGAEQLYGFSVDEILGQSSHRVLKTRHPIPIDEFLHALRRERTWKGELRHTTKEGREVVVESQHQVLEEGDGRLLVLECNRDITERKRVETSLRLSEERYRALTELSSEAIYVADREGRYILVNRRACQLLGYSQEELLARKVSDIVVPRELERLERVHQELLAGKTDVSDWTLIRKDGSEVQVEVSTRILPDGRWKALARDLTERNRAQAALARSEEKLRISLEAAEMGTWDWDVVSEELVWDDRAKSLFGLDSATPMTYERFLGAIHPDDRARVDRAVRLAIQDDVSYDIEMRVPVAGRAVRWIRSKGSVLRDAAGRPIRMSGCALDVTERKEDEQALQESEERFRLTFDQAAVGITHVGLDGRWLRVNQKICEITGYSRAEMLQTNFQRMTHPDDLQADLDQVRRLLAGEIDQYAMEKRYVRRDGSVVWVDLSVSLMRRMDGTPDYFIAIIADISSRKVVEAELQERQKELEEAQRVGGLGSWSWEPDLDRLVWSRELHQIAGIDPAGPPPSFAGQGRLFTQESWERLQTMVRDALQRGTSYESDLEMVRPDGTRRWIAVRAEVELGTHGKPRMVRGTVHDITDRKQAEEALRKTHADLEDKVRERTAELAAVNQSLRVLTGRLLQLQDDERRRISRDLHDSAGQMLVALSMNCAALKKEVSSPDGCQLLADTQALISQMTAEVRTMSYLLHPPLLDEVGLESALRWYVDGFSRRSGIEAHLEMSPSFGRLSKDEEITLFRVVQEALTNVLRHSGSKTASVQVKRDQESIELKITDAGMGIPVQSLSRVHGSGSQGVGLAGMRERIGQLGGEFTVASTEQGTEIVATLPMR